MSEADPPAPGKRQDALLLVTHVPIRRDRNGHRIDGQTAAGIAQWCKHFGKITYYGVADQGDGAANSSVWVDVADFAPAEQVEIRALPRAYRLDRTIANFRAVRAELARAVSRHRYACFTLGSLIGDWPSLAALEAIRQGVPYAAWLDRAEAVVIRNKLEKIPPARWLAELSILPLMEFKTRHLLGKSKVALLQGLDTYHRYAGDAPDPHVTYDTHTRIEDQISPELLAAKLKRVSAGSPIEILYVGRAAAMKGPQDWLGTLDRLHDEGVPFRATWIGDGPELPMMMERVRGGPIGPSVNFHGFEGDREVLLERMREADIMLFCHKTAESPRCLIEALVCGTPLVGYGTAYPEGLVAERGGGVFAPPNDSAALADRIVGLHRDRAAFADLIAQAAASGELYNEDAVYAHRAGLMKRADGWASVDA